MPLSQTMLRLTVATTATVCLAQESAPTAAAEVATELPDGDKSKNGNSKIAEEVATKMLERVTEMTEGSTTDGQSEVAEESTTGKEGTVMDYIIANNNKDKTDGEENETAEEDPISDEESGEIVNHEIDPTQIKYHVCNIFCMPRESLLANPMFAEWGSVEEFCDATPNFKCDALPSQLSFFLDVPQHQSAYLCEPNDEWGDFTAEGTQEQRPLVYSQVEFREQDDKTLAEVSDETKGNESQETANVSSDQTAADSTTEKTENLWSDKSAKEKEIGQTKTRKSIAHVVEAFPMPADSDRNPSGQSGPRYDPNRFQSFCQQWCHPAPQFTGKYIDWSRAIVEYEQGKLDNTTSSSLSSESTSETTSSDFASEKVDETHDGVQSSDFYYSYLTDLYVGMERIYKSVLASSPLKRVREAIAGLILKTGHNPSQYLDYNSFQFCRADDQQIVTAGPSSTAVSLNTATKNEEPSFVLSAGARKFNQHVVVESDGGEPSSTTTSTTTTVSASPKAETRYTAAIRTVEQLRNDVYLTRDQFCSTKYGQKMAESFYDPTSRALMLMPLLIGR